MDPVPRTSLDARTDGPSSVRLDVWLWAVRLFKTRSLAAEACRLGRVVRPDGEVVKPSRMVRAGDEFFLHEEFLKRRVKAERLLAKRVGARLVAQFMIDLTPAEEVARARALRVEQRMATPAFAPGAGRPTKAQRRALEAWHAAAEGRVVEDGEVAEGEEE